MILKNLSSEEAFFINCKFISFSTWRVQGMTVNVNLENLMDLGFNAFYSLFDCSKNFNFVFNPAIKNECTWRSFDRPRILNGFLQLDVFQVPIWSVKGQNFLDFSWTVLINLTPKLSEWDFFLTKRSVIASVSRFIKVGGRKIDYVGVKDFLILISEMGVKFIYRKILNSWAADVEIGFPTKSILQPFGFTSSFRQRRS